MDSELISKALANARAAGHEELLIRTSDGESYTCLMHEAYEEGRILYIEGKGAYGYFHERHIVSMASYKLKFKASMRGAIRTADEDVKKPWKPGDPLPDEIPLNDMV